jgi:hypothetical protein
MDPYTLVLKTSAEETRVLLRQGPDDLLRAILPGTSRLTGPKAALTFLEGLSLWLGQRLRVVLSADALDAWSLLGLTDGLGVGASSLFFTVEVLDPPVRRRGYRIRGIGDFAELRRICLPGSRGGTP